MRKTGVILAHIGYWLLFAILLLAFFFFAVYVPSHTRPKVLETTTLISWVRLMVGFAIIPGAICFYLSYTYLFTRFLAKRLFLCFVVMSGLTAFFSSLIGAVFASLPFLFGIRFLFGDGYSSAFSILLFMTLVAWVNGIIGTVLKGCLTWYHDIRLKEELARKTVEAELALVKSQIDPHFLFNTLNNIDILIAKDATKASAYLNKLTGIMRFLLYEAKDKRIGLDQEINYLQQYIDLQRIRTSNKEYVTLNVIGDFNGKTIAPMILLPFVENAFKHTELRKAESSINITLIVEEKKLIFTCDNTLIHTSNETSSGGLGIKLICKRLELLYPNLHKLMITLNNDQFKVKLELAV